MKKAVSQFKMRGVFRLSLVAVWIVTMLAQAVPVMAVQGGSGCSSQAGTNSHRDCCCNPSVRHCGCDFEQRDPAERSDPLIATSGGLMNPAERALLLPAPAGQLAAPSIERGAHIDIRLTARGPSIKLYLQTLTLRI